MGRSALCNVIQGSSRGLQHQTCTSRMLRSPMRAIGEWMPRMHCWWQLCIFSWGVHYVHAFPHQNCLFEQFRLCMHRVAVVGVAWVPTATPGGWQLLTVATDGGALLWSLHNTKAPLAVYADGCCLLFVCWLQYMLSCVLCTKTFL